MKTVLFMVACCMFCTATSRSQTVTYVDTFPRGDGKNHPVPKELQGFPYCVAVNNDEATIQPMIFHDPVTSNYFYVESDGRHITAFTPEGKLLWSRNPFVDAHMEPYRCTKPLIVWIGRDNHPDHHLVISFNSSQFGNLDDKTGDFHWRGQD